MYTKDDNPEPVSREALLRFLETVPSGQRRGHDPMMAGERSAADSDSACPDSGSRESGCPRPERYMDVALGAGSVEQSYALLEHASSCSRCASVLASSIRSLEGNPSAEESEALAELAEQREWLERMAEELAATPARRRPMAVIETMRHGGHRWRWLAAGAAAALAAAAVAGVMWLRHASAPENLLAKAYQQSRTLELRIPEAGYANLTAGTHTRGAAGDDEPAPLLEARAGLARKLQSSPENARLLELQARADVLAEHYDRAVDVLDRLLAAGPVTAELLTDAAAAYYQRGLVSSRELDRSTALDYLRRADEIAPTDPVVLFNEAVVMQDRGQMMNAVEVWNRYLTVERDGAWAQEGKRKLAALEATLNRLKSHESRVEQMLATPEAMNALTGDSTKLAAFDEELSTLKLKELTQKAFPAGKDAIEQARGSPCDRLCQAARRLLQATGRSLEIQHHDYWLSDLLSPNIESLSPTTGLEYMQAMRMLGAAAFEIQNGMPETGKGNADQARGLFADLKNRAGNEELRKAAVAGEDRSAVEFLYGLQRIADFRGCRAFAQQLHAQPGFKMASIRYPWVEGMELITEKVCHDAPEMRVERQRLEASALQVVERANYRELTARVKLRIAGDLQNAGDDEAYEHVVLGVFNELVAADSSTNRIAYTVATIPLAELDSSRAHMIELSFRESLNWFEVTKDAAPIAATHFQLANAELRIGARTEAEVERRRAYAAVDMANKGKSATINLSLLEIEMAQTMLERGETSGVGDHLDRASAQMADISDVWMLRQYTAARGQLLLSQGYYEEAARILESDIRLLEGTKRDSGGSTAAKYAEQDHDLYAELAAVWLAQGRPAANVLALWERFRLRSRGLTIPVCPAHALDCEAGRLVVEQQRLGGDLVSGQILLLDRVLVYRVDRDAVRWSVKRIQRRDLLDIAQIFERAVSSPSTPIAKTATLGAMLRDALLPELPREPDMHSELLLEPDPLLQNLSWPVLPTAVGPLGLQYGLAESPSLLAPQPTAGLRDAAAKNSVKEDALVVGASIAGDGEPPLPEALNEAQAVNGFLHAPQLLLGQQATTARLAQAIGTATVFHFAGHAVGSREGTELLLAPSSASEAKPWADGAFFRQHPPRACRLAVLSACATGEHEASWKDPLQDIVEALNQAGVPEVVATRWQVDSQASVPFIITFYQSLQGGSSVAWALTTARRVQSKNLSYNNPYYWGAYYVSGREFNVPQGVIHAGLTEKGN